MTKAEYALLEKAFSAEAQAAITKSPVDFIQSKSKLAEKMVADGLLKKVERTIGTGAFALNMTGYVLTSLGHISYCMHEYQINDKEL